MNLGDIREDRLVMGRMSPEEERAVVSKTLLVWDNLQRFWSPAHELGRQCWDYLVGDILTDKEKADARAQEKMVFEIPELVNKVNALEGMQIAGRRSGVVVPVGGEDAPDTEAMNTLIKSIHRQNGYKQESTQAFINALVTSYPSCIWMDMATDQDMNRKVEVCCEPWDAVLFDPQFRRMDLADADRIIRVRTMTAEKAMEKYPEKASVIESQLKTRMVGAQYENGLTSAQRDELFRNINSSYDLFERTGRLYIVEHNQFFLKKVTVFVSPKSSKPEILPPNWTPEEVSRWRSLHPNYQPVEMPMRILWVTTCTSNGVLLGNEMHWFQESEFPCEAYIPRVWNGKFHGLIEFLRGSLKGQSVSFMERIHGIRLANNDLTVMKEGSVVNVSTALNEVGRVGGVVIRSKTSAPDDVTFPMNRGEQHGWRDLTEDFNEQINRLSVDRNFEGGAQSSQESGKAIKSRIAQTMVKYSPYMSSLQVHDLRCTRKLVLMIPYAYTEHEVIRHITKDGQIATTEFNQPVGWDWQSGAITRVKNNLVGSQFDYVEAEADDSVTAQEHEVQQFVEILEQLKQVADMSAWPPLLTEMPNRMAQAFGRRLQKTLDAQAEAGPGIDPIKLSMNIRGEDVLHNPPLMQMLVEKGVMPPEALQMAGQGGMPTNSAPFQPQQSAQPQPQFAANVG